MHSTKSTLARRPARAAKATNGALRACAGLFIVGTDTSVGKTYVAAAMDYEVDVICTATAGRLMKKGVAEKLFVKEGSPKSVYDFIKDAHEAGVKFYCCSPNLDLFEMKESDLIPECSGIVGGAHLIEEVMASDCKVLTY